ncbi:MAG: GNAT family N-acetyltransferase [Chloroflexota bacterium]
MSVEVRPIAPDQLGAFIRAFSAAFLETISPDDLRQWQRTWERTGVIDRAIAAYDGDTIVGTSATKPFQLTVPGPASIPVAGVTAVSVLPTYRRRGILTEMTRREFESARHRGEIAAILYASEGVIYGRYGYGPATFAAHYSITTDRVAFVPAVQDGGMLALVDAAEGRRRIPEIANRHSRLRPGSIPRAEANWDDWFEDAGKEHDGMSEAFFVIHQDRNRHDDGFVAYRSTGASLPTGPRNTVTVTRLTALSDEAYVSLWGYVLHLDLVGEVNAGNRPLQEPLRWLMTDPRRLRTTSVGDGLWVRLLDIPACLEGRHYLCVGSLTVEVRDAFCPANTGTYALEVGPNGARCARTNLNADLVLGVAQLGSLYLGGVSFSELAHGTLVEERRSGALLQADRMFMSPIAPWCTTDF